MRKLKLKMHTYRDGDVYATSVIVNRMKMVFFHPDRLACMRLGSTFAWEQMK